MARAAEWGETNLRWGRYSPVYRGRLLEGAQALGQFLRTKGLDWEAIRHGKSKSVDSILDSFVQSMHKTGKKAALLRAKHGVLFVQSVRPRLHGTLKSSWQTLRSWEELSPSGFRAPMPLPLLAAFLCQARLVAVKSLDADEQNLWYVMAALVAVAFYGLLRPGELFGLTSNDVSLPQSLSLAAPFAVIRLKRPKNARQMGLQQFAELRHPDAINWLAWVLHTKSEKDAALWPSSPSRFRVMFKHVCKKMMVTNMKLSPASLRAGGATWMLDEGVEVSKIRFQGRWSNLRSLEHYLQVARAQQLALAITPRVTDHLKQLLLRHSYMLSLPKFFSAQVPSEHLIPSRACDLTRSEHVVRGIRDWGRMAKAVQESSDRRSIVSSSLVTSLERRSAEKAPADTVLAMSTSNDWPKVAENRRSSHVPLWVGGCMEVMGQDPPNDPWSSMVKNRSV
eukprot:Skav217416  [mRNA]  locus=scaffold2674:455612:458842:- [translate_table: standard]